MKTPHSLQDDVSDPPGKQNQPYDAGIGVVAAGPLTAPQTSRDTPKHHGASAAQSPQSGGGIGVLGRLGALFLVLALVLGGAVWSFGYGQALDRLAERGRSDLNLASDRLVRQLQRTREFSVLLADHPVLLAALAGSGKAGTGKAGTGVGGTGVDGPRVAAESNAETASMQSILQSAADKTGVGALFMVDATDQVLVAAVTETIAGLSGFQTGADLGDRLATTTPANTTPINTTPAKLPPGLTPALTRAHSGALGAVYFQDIDGRRLFAYAAPIFNADGRPAGALVAVTTVSAIEFGWPADPNPVFFTQADGLVFVTNRSELILTRFEGDARPFPRVGQARFMAHDLWHLAASPYLPARALYLRQDLPVIGLTAGILMDVAPARATAALQGGFAAALVLVFGAFGLFATERRRVLAQANWQLEQRVLERTEALEAANTALRHEVVERRDAETRLKQAQSELVQAGKLSALGQMSAGISHELNQPLMAIRSFAENASQFLERGQAGRVGDNLDRISDLARRMGRIIKNLRAFARQETETLTNVDLVHCVRAALEMSEGRLTRADVALYWVPPSQPVRVRGGEVRLQQVVLNLISNAVDAMDQSPRREIHIDIARGDPVVLTLRDTGPGIADPGKIFDPFYSTKSGGAGTGGNADGDATENGSAAAHGQDSGMGLGLSISYGLVQSFGGAIKGRNCPGGGAEFVVELTPAADIGGAIAAQKRGMDRP